LLDAAWFHGLKPLLSAAILDACPDAVPVDVLRALSDCRRDAIAFELFLCSELERLLRVLEQAGIAALPLKGPVLAQSLYSDSSLRPSSDLDLLVHPQDVHQVVRILKSHGFETKPYIARLPVQKLLSIKSEVHLQHQRGLELDLHWEVTPSDFHFCFDSAVLWASIGSVEFGGTKVPALLPEALLVFLCVHGTKHMWARLIWLADIARLAQSHLDWEKALDLAIRNRCERPLLLGLLLAHGTLDASIPDAYLGRARAQRIIISLAQKVKLQLASVSPADPTSLEMTIFNARLAERWWDKVGICAALLKAPTEAELEWLSLPPKLFGLYYPLRFCRLIAKYTSRLVRRI
jgi:hypothetical protein